MLVIEYKGEHLADGSDTASKKAIGELWAKHGGDDCLFLMAVKDLEGRDVRAQIMDCIGG
jgi:type III restriction enzyme